MARESWRDRPPRLATSSFRNGEHIRIDLVPEGELLLHCARLPMEAPRAVRVAALVRAGTDWERLWLLAGEHRLRPLVYHHLKSVCPTAPAPLLDRLQATYAANAARGLERTAELLAILKLFESNSIHALAYKGPLLAARIYRKQVLREMRDLDLLVHPRDVPRARALLVARGYQPRFALAPRQAAAHIRFGSEQELVWPERELTVDLHWRLASYEVDLPLTLAGLQPYLEPYSPAEPAIQTLAPEALLLVLCIHGVLHGFSRLFWLCDVAEMIRAHPDMDYAALYALAGQWHVVRLLSLGLYTACQLLDAPLPPAAQQRVSAERDTEWLAARVLAQLQAPPGRAPSLFADGLDQHYFRLRERRRDVVSFYAQRVLVGEWRRLGRPLWLLPFYEPIRLAGLWARYGWKLAARFRSVSL